MIISNITPAQVWTNSARSLTNIGSSALATINTVRTSVPTTSAVDLRTGTGVVGLATIAVQTGAAATAVMSIQNYDGANSIIMTQTAAAATSGAGFTMINTNLFGVRISNTDAAVAGFYILTQMLFTI